MPTVVTTFPTVATWNTTAGNKTVVLTPAVGDYLAVICANSGRTTAQAPTITDNNSAGTYSLVGSATKATNVDSMWVYVRNTLIPAASATTVTMAPVATDTGGGLGVFVLTGMYQVGLAGVRQFGKQDNIASGTPSVTLGGRIISGGTSAHTSVLIGGVFTASNVTTNVVEPTGWTERADLGYNTPTSGIELCEDDSGTTSGLIVGWGGAAASAFCTVLVEFFGGPPQADGSTPNRIPQLLAQ